MLLSLRAMLKPDKEARPRAFKSCAEWYAKMSEMQLLAKGLRDRDPAAYWAMDWHFKCTLWVFAEHGWPVAAAYSEQALARWDKVAESAAVSEEFEAGDWASTLETKSAPTMLACSSPPPERKDEEALLLGRPWAPGTLAAPAQGAALHQRGSGTQKG